MKSEKSYFTKLSELASIQIKYDIEKLVREIRNIHEKEKKDFS